MGTFLAFDVDTFTQLTLNGLTLGSVYALIALGYSLVYGILNQSQRQRLETDLEIDFSYAVPGRARFRVNAYYQRASLGAAFRLVPTEIKGLQELNLPKSLNEWFTTAIKGVRVRESISHSYCCSPPGVINIKEPAKSKVALIYWLQYQ